MIRSVLSLTTLGLLSAQVHAQIPILDPSPRMIRLAESFAGLPGHPTIFEVVTADIDGNLEPDLIYRFAGGFVVFMNVAASNACTRIDMPITGLACGYEYEGGDALVVSGPTGLKSLEFAYDEATRQLTYSEGLVTDASVTSLSNLIEVDFGGQVGAAVIGVGSNGTSLGSVLEDTSISIGYVLDGSFSATTQGTVFDLCAVDFDGDGQDEIVAATAFGLEVFNRLGASVTSFAFPATRGSLAKVSNGTQNQVAWARPLVGGQAEIALFDLTGSQSTVSLGPGTVVSLTSGDFDGNGASDGDDDLAVCYLNSTKLRVMENVAGGFSLANSVLISSAAAYAGGSQTSALIADLDGDGSVDFTWGDRNNKLIAIFFNRNWADFQDLIPKVDYLSIFPNNQGVSLSYVLSPAEQGRVPTDVGGLSLEVYIQHEDEITGWAPPQAVNSGPFFEGVGTSPINGHAYMDFLLFPNGIAVPPPASFASHVVARYVAVDGNGFITKKYPPLLFAVCVPLRIAAGPLDYLINSESPYQVFEKEAIGNGDKSGVINLPPPPSPPSPPPVVVPRP